MSAYKDAHYRSIIKALSWRATATISTILIVYAFTQKLLLSLGVGGVEVIVKLILYYFHERLWEVLSIGKKKHPLSEITIKKALEQKDLEIIKNKLKELGYIDD